MLKFYESCKGFCLVALLACAVVVATEEDYHDHHDHFNSTANSTNSTLLFNEKQGGNILYQRYNQTCESGLPPCSSASNLVCSTFSGTGRCVCASGYVYVRDTETCWITSRTGEDSCTHDVQCHAGKWGPLSRCSKHSSKCECYDYAKRNTTLVDGVCYIQKTPGDLCSSDDECNRPIRGEAYCAKYSDGGGDTRYNGSCQCVEGYIWHNPLKACLKKSTQLNDACVVSKQCRDGTLGKHSRCEEEAAKCICHISDNSTEPVYYDSLRKCFPRKAYNETCDEDDECRASLGPDVVCGATEEYPDEKVCHCPKGMVCRSSGFSTILAASSPYTMGVACTAAVIGVTMSINGFGG